MGPQQAAYSATSIGFSSSSKTNACCILALVGLVGYRAMVFGRIIARESFPPFEHDDGVSSLMVDLLGRDLLLEPSSKAVISNSMNDMEEQDDDILVGEEHQKATTTSHKVGQQRRIIKEAYVPSLGRNVTLPLPVILYPYVLDGSKGEQAMQICENGVHESPYLNLTRLHDFDPNVVWLLDTSKNLKRFCVQFTEKVQEIQELRAQQGLPTTWPIHVFDNGDEPIVRECASLEQLVGSENYHYHKRSIVQNRHWDDEIKWIHVGEKLIPPESMIAPATATSERAQPAAAAAAIAHRFHHVNIPVRTDMVKAVANHVDKQHNLTLNDALERDLPRPIDVAHFWPRNKQNKQQFFSSNNNNNHHNNRNNRQVQDGFMVQSSNLRDSVGLVLDKLGNFTLNNDQQRSSGDDSSPSRTRITTFAGAQGRGRMLGRSIVQEPYLQKLLSTKIHVVAQRDGWEDHFRLFEALVSGAMVMTDEMLTLPAGLEDGVSLVVYRSAQDLYDKVQYYLHPDHADERLAIAAKGRRVAMSRHRAQHRVEEMVFGTPLSLICDDCPLTLYP